MPPASSKEKGAAKSGRTKDVYLALWEMNTPQLDAWAKTHQKIFPKPNAQNTDQVAMAKVAWKNLEKALQSLQSKVEEISHKEEDEDMEDSEPQAKRPKVDASKQKKRSHKVSIIDPYNIFLHAVRKGPSTDNEEEEEDYNVLKLTEGGKLAELSVSGIVNGMALVEGGLVKNKQCDPSEGIDPQKPIPTITNKKLSEVKELANTFHKAIMTKIQADVLVTTPYRIQEMLAPELTAQEFKAVRKRIYDTVILGQGRNQDEGEDIPTAAGGAVHDIEKHKKCKTCGNNDQALFVLDRKNGDVICSNCGTIVAESLMHDGEQFRKFEGEEDRNHHGDKANPLFSSAYNMSTSLGGVQAVSGAGLAGFGTQKKGLETILRNAHAYTELNISQFGRGDRRTRIGYKDKQKKDAFAQITHCGDALNLHEAVVQRAKELFAGFRDDRELLINMKGVLAAALVEAFDQLSNEGKRLLKETEEQEAEVFTSKRANRRNELHHANLAGKGGLLLDLNAVAKKEEPQDTSDVSQKPVATWDLDECRSWLLEASRNIAQQWITDRKNGGKGIPGGTQEELEGSLVEHAIVLCDNLEAELKQKASKNMNRAVSTPRVAQMGKLGIRWQHAHERGSGGKGGVGNSGHQNNVQAAKADRTAGQILLLKTAKKLGSLLKDCQAGDAIHKELRALVGRQEARKRKKLLDEQTRQRFAQMKRKPWLQARTKVDE